MLKLLKLFILFVLLSLHRDIMVNRMSKPPSRPIGQPLTNKTREGFGYTPEVNHK